MEVGLKTGARAALLLPNAYDRLMAYRHALEDRFGEQPGNALVFHVLSKQGPLWYEGGFPVEWSEDDYKRWTARVWRPARKVAAKAPDTDDWIAGLTFYELRHSAISTALHSTLAMTKDGMNLHTLASYAGHDVQSLQRYYAHVIARYRDARPIDLETECKRARKQVKTRPFAPDDTPPGPQREAQRRRRARARAAARPESSARPPSQADASNLTLPRESSVAPPTELVGLGGSRTYWATRSLLHTKRVRARHRLDTRVSSRSESGAKLRGIGCFRHESGSGGCPG